MNGLTLRFSFRACSVVYILASFKENNKKGDLPLCAGLHSGGISLTFQSKFLPPSLVSVKFLRLHGTTLQKNRHMKTSNVAYFVFFRFCCYTCILGKEFQYILQWFCLNKFLIKYIFIKHTPQTVYCGSSLLKFCVFCANFSKIFSQKIL